MARLAEAALECKSSRTAAQDNHDASNVLWNLAVVKKAFSELEVREVGGSSHPSNAVCDESALILKLSRLAVAIMGMSYCILDHYKVKFSHVLSGYSRHSAPNVVLACHSTLQPLNEVTSMIVKIWGCRGSLPTPGANTLRYGGETTSIEVRSSSGQCIAIDAGSGIRNMGHALVNDTTVSHISLLVTHSHWDHLLGFPFFAPAYDARFSIALCGGPKGQRTVWDYLTHQFEAPYFPIDATALQATFTHGCACNRAFCDHTLPFSDRSIECHSIPLNHPNGGYGFKFVEDGKTFVFLTDNEIRFQHAKGPSRDVFVNECRGADVLFHDAQYTEVEYSGKRGWGHSTYMDAVDLAMESGVKRLGLFHHDPEHSDEDIDREVDECRNRIHSAGSDLDCFACADGMVVEL